MSSFYLIYLFLASLGLLLHKGFFSSCSKWRLLSNSSVQASLAVEHGVQSWRASVVELGLSSGLGLNMGLVAHQQVESSHTRD